MTKKPAKVRKPAKSNAAKWKPYTAARVERYRKDPGYRREVQEDRRKAMQARRGTKLKDCRDNLPDLEDFGVLRPVKLAGAPLVALTFTLAEAAEALMLSPSRMRVWVREGIVPAPVLHADVREEVKSLKMPVVVPVYTRDELEVLIELTGEHRSRIAYIRPLQHAALVQKIKKSVKEIRRSEGIG